MGLEGLFASCFISGSLAFARYDTDLSTLLFVYVRDCIIKEGETPREILMNNADDIKNRILSFSFEVKSLFLRRKLM